MTKEKRDVLINQLISIYGNESEVCMCEFLACEKVGEYSEACSFEDAFAVYLECMKRIEGDRFITIKSEEIIEL